MSFFRKRLKLVILHSIRVFTNFESSIFETLWCSFHVSQKMMWNWNYGKLWKLLFFSKKEHFKFVNNPIQCKITKYQFGTGPNFFSEKRNTISTYYVDFTDCTMVLETMKYLNFTQPNLYENKYLESWPFHGQIGWA